MSNDTNSNKSYTNVCGYYNGARWSIQLVISRFNITLTLKPGEYLLDRQGRKINDPYFDVYVKNKQLSKETSDTPVPLITVPVITPSVAATTPGSSPVRAVTEWKLNDRGIRQPVLTPKAEPKTDLPVPSIPMVSANASSVRPMTMQEARDAGFVRKVREVPEDYGVTDTTGLPPSRIPQMKYSIDPTVGKTAKPLPKELLQLPKDDPSNPARSQLVTNLAQGSQTPPPEDGPASPFGNTAVPNAPENSPITAGAPAPLAESQLEDITDVEPPDLGPDATPQLGVPEPVADPEEVSPRAAIQAEITAKPAGQPAPRTYRCPVCSKSCGTREQLKIHANNQHRDKYSAIMELNPA